MTENPRIAELRRRVLTDPASIAFAQLAEEHRRDGDYEEAIRVCRTGLAQYPAYLSARVTLGRALGELGQFDEAKTELEYVLKVAPDNLAANRALAELHQRRDSRIGAAARDTVPPEPVPTSTAPTSTAPTEAAPTEAAQTDAVQTDAVQTIAGTEHVHAPLPTSSPESRIPDPEREPPANPSSDTVTPPRQGDPALARLEGWLESILQDRSARQRTSQGFRP